jgi:hypothetical protein
MKKEKTYWKLIQSKLQVQESIQEKALHNALTIYLEQVLNQSAPKR